MPPSFPRSLSLRASPRGEEAGHDIAGQPGGGVEAGRRAEGRQPIGAANALGGREAPPQPVADDRSDLVGPWACEAEQSPALADAAIADGDRPVVEQVLAEDEFVPAVMVPVGVVSLEGHG